MKTCSVYLDEKSSALSLFATQNGITTPIGGWRETAEDKDLITAVLETSRNADQFFVSGINNPLKPGESVIKGILKTKAIPATTAQPFSLREGLCVYEWLKSEGGFMGGKSFYQGWPKLESELRQAERVDSPEVMAFLQGLVETRKFVERPPIELRASTDGSGSPLPDTHIPVALWGTNFGSNPGYRQGLHFE